MLGETSQGDRMNLMKIFSIILFLFVTLVHLYASGKMDGKMRDLTKPFILLSLIGIYCFSTEKIVWTVVLALCFSWLGDLFLMGEGPVWFITGGISFTVSHLFFILSYLKETDPEKIGIVTVILLMILYFFPVLIIFDGLRPHLPKDLFYPMFLYLFINGMMNCFAIFRFLSFPSLKGIVTVFGSALFFLSDTFLFFVQFKKESRLKTSFSVMCTYALGELLITLGLIQ